LTNSGWFFTVPGSLAGFSPLRTGLIERLTERYFVNVTVENLAPCKKLMRVEIETQKVDEAFDHVTKEF